MLEDFQGDSWGSIPPLRMSSLLPHDLCHGRSASCRLPTSFVDLCYCFIYLLVCFYFTYFCSDIYDFFLLTLSFLHSSFYSCFRYKVRLFIWGFYYFLRWDWIAINFHLRTAFVVSHRFWVIMFSLSFVSMYFYFIFNFFSDVLVI